MIYVGGVVFSSYRQWFPLWSSFWYFLCLVVWRKCWKILHVCRCKLHVDTDSNCVCESERLWSRPQHCWVQHVQIFSTTSYYSWNEQKWTHKYSKAFKCTMFQTLQGSLGPTSMNPTNKMSSICSSCPFSPFFGASVKTEFWIFSRRLHAGIFHSTRLPDKFIQLSNSSNIFLWLRQGLCPTLVAPALVLLVALFEPWEELVPRDPEPYAPRSPPFWTWTLLDPLF